MATGAVNTALLLSGPGILYYAPLGTAEPTHTPTNSKFPTTAWGGGWLAVGSTDNGSEFRDAPSTDDMTVAESMYPVKVVTTGRSGSWRVALAEINTQNLKLALNGGSATVSGSAGTTLTQVDPVTVGSETRVMLGWQSEDDSVRFVARQCLQVGDLGAAFRKGADKATLDLEFRFEKPSGANAYSFYLAGTARA